MAYSIAIFCEADVLFSARLSQEFSTINFPDKSTAWPCIGYRAAHRLFTSFQYHENGSILFLLCKALGSDFYENFYRLAYIEDFEFQANKIEPDCILDLQLIKSKIIQFHDKLSKADKEQLTRNVKKLISKVPADKKQELEHEIPFLWYITENGGLTSTLEKALVYIELFERCGAQRIIFAYG